MRKSSSKQTKEWIEKTGEKIEETLRALLSNAPIELQSLWEAAQYSTLSGGKRIRPFLTLSVVEALGGSIELALKPAAAIELIHVYSLIHDDLPAMDNDDFRRGIPSLHKAYSEGEAILTGDFLLTYAFEILATDPLLPPAKKLELIRILALAAGGRGMVGGQSLDISWEGQEIPLHRLKMMYAMKTGALIEASVQFGAILSSLPEEAKHPLALFGKYLGLAYQIRDDIVDISTKKSDERNQKSTFVTHLGIEEAEEEFRSALAKAKICLEGVPCKNTLLHNLLLLLE